MEYLLQLRQVEEVRLPRMVLQDRSDPLLILSEEEFTDRYRLTKLCTMDLLDQISIRLPRARDGRGNTH